MSPIFGKKHIVLALAEVLEDGRASARTSRARSWHPSARLSAREWWPSPTTGIACKTTNSVRRALEYAKMFDLPVMDHCQDYSLVTTGVMHEGYWNTALGLRGWPSAGEEMMVARNVLLAEVTGARVHCQHLSAAGSVKLLRDAIQRGLPVSAEACPHHFTLTDAAVAGSDKFWAADGKGVFGVPGSGKTPPAWPAYDTNFKMNPPLRSARDREAIIEGRKI